MGMKSYKPESKLPPLTRTETTVIKAGATRYKEWTKDWPRQALRIDRNAFRWFQGQGKNVLLKARMAARRHAVEKAKAQSEELPRPHEPKFLRRKPGTAPCTAAERRSLMALGMFPDSEIDFPDIPPLTRRWFNRAVLGRELRPHPRPPEAQVTVRLAPSVLAWLFVEAKHCDVTTMLRYEMLVERNRERRLKAHGQHGSRSPHRR
jgi:hypothetical protein